MIKNIELLTITALIIPVAMIIRKNSNTKIEIKDERKKNITKLR